MTSPTRRPTEVRRALVAFGACAVALRAAALLPSEWIALATGGLFLAGTFWLALRRANPRPPSHYGLALGGLFDAEPLSARRLLGDTARAFAVALALGALLLPPYWLLWVSFWKPAEDFVFTAPPGVLDLVLGQLLVIALPEEAFFRGALQSVFDERWPPRRRILGAPLGLGVLVASALFALIHLVTTPHPERLAVFFPGLVFGWLRARTGGIGAAVVFHALANVFATFLARGYGLG